MLKKDQNSEKSGGEEADLPNGPDLENISDEELNSYEGSGSDPLDAIEDETVRAKEKKARAIGRRILKHQAKPPVKKVTPPSDDDEEEGDDDEEEDDDNKEPKIPKNVATKDDLKTIATNGAKKLVPDEVLAVWDELVAIPLGGFKPMDEQSIAENFIRRYNVYIIDNPGDEDDPATPFQVSVIQKSGGSKQTNKKAIDERPLPGYKEVVPPEEWYGKPEKK